MRERVKKCFLTGIRGGPPNARPAHPGSSHARRLDFHIRKFQGLESSLRAATMTSTRSGTLWRWFLFLHKLKVGPECR